jgi:RND superfamily putative drug exporter
VFWPFVPRFGTPTHEESGPWGRIADSVGRRPRTVWVVGLAVLGVFCIGLTGLHADGLSDKNQFVGKPDSIKGEAVLAAHFGGGDAGAPVVIVANASAATQVEKAAASVPGIVSTGVAPTTAHGDVELVLPLKEAADSATAQRAMQALRIAVHSITGADALVGGTTAITYDTEQSAAHDHTVVIPIVLALVFVILMLLLRAVIAPLLLIASVVLSYFAALGASSFAWPRIFGFTQADASSPLYLFISWSHWASTTTSS